MGKKKLEIERLQNDLDWAMNEIDDLRYKNKKLSNENHSLKMEFNRGLDKIITSERLIIVRKDYIIKQLQEELLQCRLPHLTTSDSPRQSHISI